MINARPSAAGSATLGPHLYCCGHVHAAWAFGPPRSPTSSASTRAPLLRGHSGLRPGFLEIELDGPDVSVHHHAWTGEAWEVQMLDRRTDSSPSTPVLNAAAVADSDRRLIRGVAHPDHAAGAGDGPLLIGELLIGHGALRLGPLQLFRRRAGSICEAGMARW